MKTSVYATDLLILPETETEKQEFLEYCKLNLLKPVRYYSNVGGQEWFGKWFYEIAFRSDLRLQFQQKFNS